MGLISRRRNANDTSDLTFKRKRRHYFVSSFSSFSLSSFSSLSSSSLSSSLLSSSSLSSALSLFDKSQRSNRLIASPENIAQSLF
jgi:hypothetical protein